MNLCWISQHHGITLNVLEDLNRGGQRCPEQLEGFLYNEFYLNRSYFLLSLAAESENLPDQVFCATSCF